MVIDLALMLISGAVVGWFARGAWYGRRAACLHSWGRWDFWFVLASELHQRRYCTKCMASEQRGAGRASRAENAIGQGRLVVVDERESVSEHVH